MIYKCRFCDFRREGSFDLEFMRKCAQAFNEGIGEDFALYIEKMWNPAASKAYNGVKVHMGIKHKGETYKGIWPESEYTVAELAIVSEVLHD